tara:strand:+ start:1827 stop:2195 length:369 start_codon:yes stop_codon:yes gene_type:complete
MSYNHKEYMKEYNQRKKKELQEYWKTPKGKKTKRISEWRRWGIKGDLDEIYDIFINTQNCDICKRELTTDKYATSTRRSLDHSHITLYYRFVCCHSCNTKIGFQERRFKKVNEQMANRDKQY